MESSLFIYPVDEQAFEDLGGNYKLTLRSKGREIQVNSFDEEIASGIVAFFPDRKGSVYKPVQLVNGSIAKAYIRGSMTLMVELGWISSDSLRHFSELIYGNHFWVGCFSVEGSTKTIQVRFSRKQDLSLLSGKIVKISNWNESWSHWAQIILSSGITFQGKPQGLSLLDAIDLNLVDADRGKVEEIDKASAALRQAIKDYHSTLKKLGGAVHSDGDYEDHREWYEIPDLPGTWACPDISDFS